MAGKRLSKSKQGGGGRGSSSAARKRPYADVAEGEDDAGGGSRAPAPRNVSRSTSTYKGVTLHCRTGRWEAHIWEQGKQVYLGGFDTEEQAALAYDLACIKCRGESANTNYAIQNYEEELRHVDEEVTDRLHSQSSYITKEELIMSLRRESKAKTARGTSRFRYLGLFDSEIEAAQAYDREAIRQQGTAAVTNFAMSEYQALVDSLSISPEDDEGNEDIPDSAHPQQLDRAEGSCTVAKQLLPHFDALPSSVATTEHHPRHPKYSATRAQNLMEPLPSRLAPINTNRQTARRLPSQMNAQCSLLTPIHLLDSVMHGVPQGGGGGVGGAQAGSPLGAQLPRADNLGSDDQWFMHSMTSLFHHACFSPMSDTSLGTTPK